MNTIFHMRKITMHKNAVKQKLHQFNDLCNTVNAEKNVI